MFLLFLVDWSEIIAKFYQEGCLKLSAEVLFDTNGGIQLKHIEAELEIRLKKKSGEHDKNIGIINSISASLTSLTRMKKQTETIKIPTNPCKGFPNILKKFEKLEVSDFNSNYICFLKMFLNENSNLQLEMIENELKEIERVEKRNEIDEFIIKTSNKLSSIDYVPSGIIDDFTKKLQSIETWLNDHGEYKKREIFVALKDKFEIEFNRVLESERKFYEINEKMKSHYENVKKLTNVENAVECDESFEFVDL